MVDKLKYTNTPRKKAGMQYFAWRKVQKLPLRCDIPECIFHSNPPLWNGKQLVLILDHKNGVNSDDRPKNLRLLCPNCDSQQTETKAGANKGRVKKSEGGFAIRSKDGKVHYTLPADGSPLPVNAK